MYYDPYDLLVGVVAEKLELECRDKVDSSDLSRVDIVKTYDFSGDPTKASITANKIIVSPDSDIGSGRGDYPHQSAIGLGPRTWVYHVEIKIETFPIRTTKEQSEIRDIIAKISGRVINAIHELARDGFSDTTEDGHWTFVMGDTKLVQGGGPVVKDAGSSKAIKATRTLIAGFILGYTP